MQKIDENVELRDISSSRERKKRQIVRIQTRKYFIDCCHQFVEIKIECVEHSSYYSCESFSQFVEIHAKKRANRTK